MRKFAISSILKKLIMSISGLFLIIFLLIHLGANLVAVFSADAYNTVCHFMDTNILIRIMVPVLALGFVIHIAYALVLTLQNMKARGNDKYGCGTKTDIKWASQNMFVLGLIIFGFLALHLIHFWAKMQLQTFLAMAGIDSNPAESPYMLVVDLFTNPVYVAVYLVWIAALWFHLTHGFWSAFQTIGLSNSNWAPRIKCIGTIYAWVVALGFAFIPVYFLLMGCCAN